MKSNFGLDKALHFGVCFLIVAVVALICYGVLDMPKMASSLAGVCVGVVLGFGKEVFDKYVRLTGFDWSDIVADVCGVVLAFLCTLFM